MSWEDLYWAVYWAVLAMVFLTSYWAVYLAVLAMVYFMRPRLISVRNTRNPLLICTREMHEPLTTSTSFKLLNITYEGWCQTRSPLPALLVGAGVPDDVWHHTYDGIMLHVESMAKQWRTKRIGTMLMIYVLILTLVLIPSDWGGLAFNVLNIMIVLCEVTYLIQRRAVTASWLAIVSREDQLYRAYGFTVKRIGVIAPATCWTDLTIIGGLLFEKSCAGSNIVQDSESLQNLHNAGALTDDEHAKTKNTVQASADNHGTTAAMPVQAEAEIGVPEAGAPYHLYTVV